MQPIILRFAPSPNGRLHLGHAYSALLNAQLATQLGGVMLLRVEDIDLTRCTPELTEACIEDLEWLGLSWPQPVRLQSEHFGDYQAALDLLKARNLVYPCFCSRREIEQASTVRDPDGAALYPGTCRALSSVQTEANIAQGLPHSWRLKIDAALAQTGALSWQKFDPDTQAVQAITVQPERWGDVILARKEIPTSYHLSVVVDDALQSISHVVRGMDLLPSTCVHTLLQALLQLPRPLYFHHPLITLPQGEKMAKSKQSLTLAELREQGKTLEEVKALAGF